jgi:hypothetical protein
MLALSACLLAIDGSCSQSEDRAHVLRHWGVRTNLRFWRFSRLRIGRQAADLVRVARTVLVCSAFWRSWIDEFREPVGNDCEL